MYRAPSVSYPVERSRFLGGLLAVLVLAGVAAGAMVGQRTPLHAWQVVVVWAVILLAGLGAGFFWRSLPQGELRWDGHCWEGPGAATRPSGVRVHLDLQRHLLVRLQEAGDTGSWLWLSAASRPERWDDVRRAVYSRAMTEAKQDGANP
jgi:toxin CptA